VSDEEGEVAEANAGFYRAFETLDLSAMDAVWLHAGHVRCVHPGWPMLAGWDAVRASWDTIFRNTTEMHFTISDLVVTVCGDLGWVTCTENILGQVGDRVSVTSVLATNLFERAGAEWRMVHHHASHVLGPPEPA
jgi:ketosteroid isomerase-like protein